LAISFGLTGYAVSSRLGILKGRASAYKEIQGKKASMYPLLFLRFIAYSRFMALGRSEYFS